MSAVQAEGMRRYLKQMDSVQGWFPLPDRQLFTVLGDLQADAGVRGHLLEIGAFFGLSAIMLGFFARSDEQFVVCDLFEDPAPDRQNQREKEYSYHSRSLTREGFEDNYLRFHDQLPRIEQRPSSELTADSLPTPMRFVHIDGSHVYDHARSDILLSRDVLGANGVVVVDDYRSAHTAGVAAAVWQAVTTEGFIPLCITSKKFYGTWQPWEPELVEQLKERLRRHDRFTVKQQRLGQHVILRALWNKSGRGSGFG